MSTGSNGSGSYRTSPEQTMAAFDKLPRTARLALAEAAFDWAVQPMLTKHRRGYRGYKTGPEIAAHIPSIDRNHHEKDAKRGKVAPLLRGEPVTPRRRRRMTTP